MLHVANQISAKVNQLPLGPKGPCLFGAGCRGARAGIKSPESSWGRGTPGEENLPEVERNFMCPNMPRCRGTRAVPSESEPKQKSHLGAVWSRFSGGVLLLRRVAHEATDQLGGLVTSVTR